MASYSNPYAQGRPIKTRGSTIAKGIARMANQFGQDAGNGLASDTSNMGALLGSAIGGPERKSTELDSKKLNLFGSVPRY